MSTGAYAFTRRITNVTAGTADTDAANVGQLNALIDVNNTSGALAPSATGNNSIAIGGGSVASEENVVSVGNATTQRRITNVAAGTAGTDAVNKDQLDAAIASVTSDTSSLEEAKAYTDDKIAVNNTSGALDPSATGADSVAVGSGAVASAANTVAVGSNAQATGTNAIAIGRGATATGSVAVGTGASASNGGSAFGDNTTSSGTNSAAIGYGATSTGSNSGAIGSNSTDGGESNVVSVGNTTTQRRITNVDAGVNDTDAVNVSQLNAVSTNIVSGANAYTDRKINDLSDEAHRGIAGAIAMSRAIMSLNPGESGISAGFGESGGQGAVAMSFQHSTKDNIQFNIGASFDTQNVQVGGGIGIKF
ncbi:MAG: YadA-like family protein [Smithella sp.]